METANVLHYSTTAQTTENTKKGDDETMNEETLKKEFAKIFQNGKPTREEFKQGINQAIKKSRQPKIPVTFKVNTDKLKNNLTQELIQDMTLNELEQYIRENIEITLIKTSHTEEYRIGLKEEP